MFGKENAVVNIRTQVYNAIKENICDGRYEPGQRLNEVELARSLSVSRSPVREALRRLAADGLVVELPNRGVFGREFTPQDIQEIFDVRVLLESYCIQRSVQFMTTEHKQELMRCLDQITYYHERQDMKKHIEADCQLHGLIIRIGGNRLVEDMYQRISAQVQQFRIYSLESKRRFRESLVEHTTVVHCLLTGNVEEGTQYDATLAANLYLALDNVSEDKLAEMQAEDAQAAADYVAAQEARAALQDKLF